MIVTVVQVRPMRVVVLLTLVPVGMGVGLGPFVPPVRVPVVLVVTWRWSCSRGSWT